MFKITLLGGIEFKTILVYNYTIRIYRLKTKIHAIQNELSDSKFKDFPDSKDNYIEFGNYKNTIRTRIRNSSNFNSLDIHFTTPVFQNGGYNTIQKLISQTIKILDTVFYLIKKMDRNFSIFAFFCGLC